MRRARDINAHRDYQNGNPLISIYIPTYNRCELLISRSVPSVLRQNYANFELVIVGDCCTDNTEHEINKIKDERIKFSNLSKRGYRYPPTAENHWLAGPVVAANYALSLVKGMWIARIDDDDIWTEDHLEKLLKGAQEKNLEFVSGSYIKESDGQAEIISPKDFNPPIGGTQTWLYRDYLKLFKYNLDCWRKKWNKVNDTDLQDRMFKSGVKMGYIKDVICRIIPRPGDSLVGSRAYKARSGDYEDFYKFDNN